MSRREPRERSSSPYARAEARRLSSKDHSSASRSSRPDPDRPERRDKSKDLSDRRPRTGYDDDRPKRSKRSHKRPAELSDDDLLDLREMGVEPITNEDYFLRSSEYRYWLKEERGRYLDELNSEDAHKYFRRFVRRWNDGALKEKYYRPPKETASTRHKWSFSSNAERNTHQESASQASPFNKPAADIHTAYSRDKDGSRPRSSSSSSEIGPLPPDLTKAPALNRELESDEIGPRPPPSIPLSAADRRLALEDAQLARRQERKSQLTEQYRRADEAVPRSSGKEGKMEEKRATNASNKEMRDKDATGAGLEVDEGTLMGDQGGFAAALRARDAAKNRREEQKAIAAEERRMAEAERLAERRQKDSDTMAIFKAMAKERFG